MLNHEEVQAAISARLDGEDYALGDDIIDAHVVGCPECAAFQNRAIALSRRLITPDGIVAPQDLSELILAGVEPQWRAASAARQLTLAVLRVAAIIVALAFVIGAVLLVGDSSSFISWGNDGHTLAPQADPEKANLVVLAAALHFGLAFGLFFSAWRPSCASGVLTVATPMMMFQAGFAMRDIAVGTLSSQRLIMLLGLGFMVLILGWMWAADKGYVVRALWKQLSADPA